MKVVLFCGGLGTRLREYSDTIPKPMVSIGYRPIIWHLMKYYAHFGHKDFVLALGYRGDIIKHYFTQYDERLSNDFVLSDGGRKTKLFNSDIEDWTITFADTGSNSNIGQRLLAVRKYLDGEPMFMANYSDGLSDLNLDSYVKEIREHGKIGNFITVRPPLSYHMVTTDAQDNVRAITAAAKTDMRINGGFFVFKQAIFDYMNEGEELVEEPFQRLIEAGQLNAHRHDGFFACMDTMKDKQMFDNRHNAGDTPWEVWKQTPREAR